MSDSPAPPEVFASAYDELRRLARARLYAAGSRPTGLDTTALVHETYLRVLRSGGPASVERRAYFAYAGQVMRSVIVDAVRERQAERRGGDLERVTLVTGLADGAPAEEAEILAVHEAIEALQASEPELAQVVTLRYFAGLGEAEIGATLGVTERTVRRHWDKARRLLAVMLRG